MTKRQTGPHCFSENSRHKTQTRLRHASCSSKRARVLLEAAAASSNPQAAPLAQANLGLLLIKTGELEQARVLLEAAAASGHPQAAPAALAALRTMQRKQQEKSSHGLRRRHPGKAR
jgi:hypothetical protein